MHQRTDLASQVDFGSEVELEQQQPGKQPVRRGKQASPSVSQQPVFPSQEA